MSERRDDTPESSKRKAHEVNLADENLTDALCEFSPIKKPRPDGDPPPPDEAPHDNRPIAMPRISYLLLAPEEGYNVPRTLNQLEANPEFPILRLRDTFEAYVVLDCPRFIDYSTMFRVFDKHNTPYNMQLLLLDRFNGLIEPYFSLGWARFVNDHNLGAGDLISFNKNLDTTISDDFYYMLKYVKKPESSKKPGDVAESSGKPGDGAESSKKPGDVAQSSGKPGDGAESSKKPGDGAESSGKPGDGAESSKKPCDVAESSGKPGDGAESSRKPSDGAESSRYPGDSVESSRKPDDGAESPKKPGDTTESIGMPVFKVIYHRVLLETPPDQEQRIEPRPGSRPFQLEAICLSKTLTAAEVGPRLFFDVYDAIILADNPRVAETLPGDMSEEFIVFDRDDRRYDMTLIHYVRRGGIIGFCLDGWDRFIMNHDLNRGDRVAFYKFLDRRIHYGYYYVVLKLPADVDCQNRRNPIGPGSRALMPESHCFSKILSQNEVSRFSGLELEALQARHFESSRRSLNEPFMVFGGDDRQYEMNLTYYFHRERGLMCFLDNAGWESFVEHHNLGAGDTIHVNKILDQSVCDDHYFVITYSRLGMEF